MKRLKLSLAIAVAMGSLCVGSLAHADDGDDKSPHKFRGNLELEFRTNTNINVAPATTDSFDFATFADFEEAEEKLAEEEDEEGDEDDDADGDDDGGDDDFGSDDFDLAGIEDTDLSEEDFDFLTDDDDGDGDEDDPNDDGNNDDEGDDDGDGQDDDGEDNDDDETGSSGKRSSAPDNELDDLVNQSVVDKVGTRSTKANRSAVKFGFSHKYKISKIATWGSSFRAATDFNNGRSSLDKSNLAVSTGPEFAWKKKGFKVKPAVSFVQIRQDGNSIVSTWVGTLAAAYDISKKFGVDVVYNYQDKDVTNPDSPDAVINTLTFGAEWIVTKQDIVKAKISPRVEDSSLVTKNKDTSGWQLTYSRKLPYEVILGLGVKDDRVDYKNLPRPREDDIRAYSVELTKAWGKNFESALSWESRELDSSVNTKDAKNRSVVVSVNYKF